MKAKEISQELEDKNTAICITCGAILENIDSIFAPCPICSGICQGGLRWITPGHSWITTLIVRGTEINHKEEQNGLSTSQGQTISRA